MRRASGYFLVEPRTFRYHPSIVRFRFFCPRGILVSQFHPECFIVLDGLPSRDVVGIAGCEDTVPTNGSRAAAQLVVIVSYDRFRRVIDRGTLAEQPAEFVVCVVDNFHVWPLGCRRLLRFVRGQNIPHLIVFGSNAGYTFQMVADHCLDHPSFIVIVECLFDIGKRIRRIGRQNGSLLVANSSRIVRSPCDSQIRQYYFVCEVARDLKPRVAVDDRYARKRSPGKL